MGRTKKKEVELPQKVIFRPDSRNAFFDYYIPYDVAEDLFHRGIIHGDRTNGGYMPNPASRYNVRQHKLDVPEFDRIQRMCLAH